jgi:phosphomannomutase
MIYMFDIDGTLTEPRQKIHPEFAKFFRDFCNKYRVYLVTGSDLPKVYEQLDSDIIERYVRGVFSDMGNTLTRGQTTIYKNVFMPPDSLQRDLENTIQQYSLLKTGNHIEHRNGMINFSLIGRNATKEQRDQYAKDEEAQRIRKNVVEYLSNIYKSQGLEFVVGGQISVDIHPKGCDKRQAVRWVRENHYTTEIAFLGDKTFKGGNDHTAALEVEAHGGIVYQVDDWKETKEILECLSIF